MTICYNYDVSTQSLFKLYRLTFRWRGSVWQCIYKECCLWILLYVLISILYRFILNEVQQGTFEQLVQFSNSSTPQIPVTFLLGFYVTLVMNRWWAKFIGLPWPDDPAFRIASYIEGSDGRALVLKKTICRLMVLAFGLLFREISIACHKRFPTVRHFVEAGLMTEAEYEAYEVVDNSLGWTKYWLPMNWLCYHLRSARNEGYIASEMRYTNAMDSLALYRGKLGTMFDTDSVNVPLVYTQVAHVAIRSYFFACLVSRQFLDPAKKIPGYEFDCYLPPFTLLELVFYLGWLKVAEVALNPFGEDDDDFEINFMVDRNLQVVNTYIYQIEHPPPLPEEQREIEKLPYTKASKGLMDGSAPAHHLGGSVADVPVSRRMSMFVENTVDDRERSVSTTLFSFVRGIKQTISRRTSLRRPRAFELRRHTAEGLGTTPRIFVTDTAQSSPSRSTRSVNFELPQNDEKSETESVG